MGGEANNILGAMLIGIGATLVMDLWNLFMKRMFGSPSLNYCLLGRWLRHMPGGTLGHASITAASQKPFECAVGWTAHYTIGVVFALAFVVLTSGDWLARPTVLPAVLYGTGTVVFPFLIMQPSRSWYRFLKNAQTSAGQAEEPYDTLRIRSRAVCLCTWRELHIAAIRHLTESRYVERTETHGCGFMTPHGNHFSEAQ